MLSGYRIESLIGTGVNCATYGARQMASGGRCLIRILSAGDSDEEFLREAKLASAFFHPNVVDVYDAGALEDGEVFVVSERPDGTTLRDLLNETPVPKLLTTIEIIRQAAEALHAIHLCGFTHGALNPENIILTEDPEGTLLVRLRNLDFGRVLEHSITGNKFVVETALASLRYYAPEQCSGEAVTAQTDVYSLGVVFYEMLAGSPPFDAATATALIHKQKTQPPPDVRIDDFHLRMLVTHSLTESLQKPARLRQRTANAFARQLRHIEQLATHVSTPPPAGTVTTRNPATPKISPAPVFDMPVNEIREVASFVDERNIAEVEDVPEYEEAFDLKVADVLPESVDDVPADAIVHEFQREAPVEIHIEAADVVNVDDIETATGDAVTNVLSEPRIHVPERKDDVHEILASPARRSRLKHLKKKLHGYTAQIGNPTPEVGRVVRDEDPVTEIVETAVRENDIEITPVEVPQAELHSVDPITALSVEVDPAETALSTQSELDVEKLETMEPAPASLPLIVTAAESEKTESATAQEPEKIVAAPVRRKRKKAELEKAKTAAVEAIAELEVPRQPAFEATVIERKPDVAEAAVAAADTGKRPTLETKQKSKAMAATAGSARLHTKELVPDVHPKADEDEDITLVRPRSRIKVEWAKPRTIYRPDAFSVRYRDEVKFVPTLLDKAAPTRVDLYANQDGMFSEQYSSTDRGSIPYRAVAISIGVVALMGIFLFANDSISRYFQGVSPGDSVTAKATETAPATKAVAVPKVYPRQAVPVSAVQVQTAAVPESGKSLPETGTTVTTEIPKTATAKERGSNDRNASPPAEAKHVDTKAPATAKTDVTRSAGKAKPKPESAKKQIDKAPVATAEKAGSATRPRIVQEPRD